jgi:hypothetical protein
VRDDYEEPAYGMIDTLFSLAEAYLFMQLVELVVRQVAEDLGERVLRRKSVKNVHCWAGRKAVRSTYLFMQLVVSRVASGLGRVCGGLMGNHMARSKAVQYGRGLPAHAAGGAGGECCSHDVDA